KKKKKKKKKLSFLNTRFLNLTIYSNGAIMLLRDTALQMRVSKYVNVTVNTSPDSQVMSGNIVLLFSESNRLGSNDSFFNSNSSNTSVIWIDRSLFVNSANVFNGGVFYVETNMESDAMMIVTNCQFAQNLAWKYGAAIGFTSTTHVSNFKKNANGFNDNVGLTTGMRLFLKNCTFVDNSLLLLPQQDGLQTDDNSASGGGAIYVALFQNVTGDDSIFGNKNETAATWNIDESVHQICILNCTFENNRAVNINQNGGALFVKHVVNDHNLSSLNTSFSQVQTNYHVLRVAGCRFLDNTCTENGGAIAYSIAETGSSFQ
ncbi:adhesin-like protein, partial [Reticulomyxa filosa]